MLAQAQKTPVRTTPLHSQSTKRLLRSPSPDQVSPIRKELHRHEVLSLAFELQPARTLKFVKPKPPPVSLNSLFAQKRSRKQKKKNPQLLAPLWFAHLPAVRISPVPKSPSPSRSQASSPSRNSKAEPQPLRSLDLPSSHFLCPS
ncbi:hypothetical protein KFK09_004790 [Dendrobium nobile]|uniref:Uncharacterized protein n=1 Tax=Dendrobium nobile TaxID=94219 RepID=A0A8T3BWJ1_DENNO|nr:hypothetical protein KFK09_004790 [Dendrobium nobile]